MIRRVLRTVVHTPSFHRLIQFGGVCACLGERGVLWFGEVWFVTVFGGRVYVCFLFRGVVWVLFLCVVCVLGEVCVNG